MNTLILIATTDHESYKLYGISGIATKAVESNWLQASLHCASMLTPAEQAELRRVLQGWVREEMKG